MRQIVISKMHRTINTPDPKDHHRHHREEEEPVDTKKFA
jgi:hypothetical protein